MSLMGFFSHPSLRANGPASMELSATARRCILWNGHLACVDFGQPQLNGEVAVLDVASGLRAWSFSLAAARPDFAAETRTLFMARVASLGTDRLAALFEAYPADTTGVTDCRAYYLAMLDAGGSMVAATKVADPFLSSCNHPHPYGVAADRDGNVYLQFAPSTNASAPLVPGAPTLTISYTRDGVHRWSRIDDYQGGELAVANGLLFAENAHIPYDTASGQPFAAAPAPAQRLGRIVSDGALYVRSPALAGSTIDAFGRSGNPAWAHSMPAGDVFLSPELRLAQWTPRVGRSDLVVLSATARQGLAAITAFRARDGAELWSCGLGLPPGEIPQQFEIADDSVAMMSGAGTCGPCDPPYADSRASFWELAMPGISPGFAPWVGTFGGPGHDHLEDALPVLRFSSSNTFSR
jgi:hypothetical protein